MFLNIKEIIKSVDYKMLLEIIALNEVSGRTEVATKFSNAGTGKSGYSFGVSQFDVSNNCKAREFLLNHGFTSSDITRLLNMDKNIRDLNQKLYKLKDEIYKFDLDHIKASCKYLSELSGIPPLTTKTFMHLLDYHNQFNLSKNGKMHNFLRANTNYLLSSEVLNFKLNNTKWGKEYPKDVWRRYYNIEKYFDMNVYDEGEC